MVFFIKGGVLYTAENAGGASKRIVGDNIVRASLNESTKEFVIVRSNGKVEIVNMNGLVIRNICEGAVDAQYDGDNVLVRDGKGVNTIRNKNGLVLRTF